jgi:hypothetical protein
MPAGCSESPMPLAAICRARRCLESAVLAVAREDAIAVQVVAGPGVAIVLLGGIARGSIDQVEIVASCEPDGAAAVVAARYPRNHQFARR